MSQIEGSSPRRPDERGLACVCNLACVFQAGSGFPAGLNMNGLNVKWGRFLEKWQPFRHSLPLHNRLFDCFNLRAGPQDLRDNTIDRKPQRLAKPNS